MDPQKITNYFEIGGYAAKRKIVEDNVRLLSDDKLIQRFTYLLYLPNNSSVNTIDQRIITDAIEFRKTMLLQKITNFSVTPSLGLIKKRIFTSQLKLSDLEVQETFNLAKEFHITLNDFYQHLQLIWR